jgi:diphthamide biosynthesis protein 7
MIGVVDTVMPACSVEFLGSVALIGTYELREATRTKHGTVHRVETAGDSMQPMDDVREMPSAVLDIKCSSLGTVACALSDGSLTLLNDASLTNIVASLRRNSGDDAALALALEWSDRKIQSSRQLCASYSDGGVALFDVASEQCVSAWKAHSLEAWTVAFDCWQPSVVMSGADDGRFHVWDVRAPLDAPVSSRRYDMGVTAVQSHTMREHCVAVGSYDESIAVYDLRALRAAPLARFESGGGVWRLKWRPDGADVLLAACMHAGFATLEFCDGERELRALEQWFAPHTSMAYGADWRGDSALLACCSFYDHCFTLYRHDHRQGRRDSALAAEQQSAPSASSAAPPAP